MEKFQNKYRIPSARLKGYDYGSNGLYFVTICTKNRKCYFGNIVAETHNAETHNAETHNVETHNAETHNAETHNVETHNVETHNAETHNAETHNVETHNVETHNVETHNCASLQATEIGQIAIDYWKEIPKHYPFVELDEFVIMPNHIHGILIFNKTDYNEWNPNQFGVQSKNLGAVIRGFKSSTKRFANQHNIEFEWQSRYHDRIIRNENELNAIRRYIINNPQNWLNDVLNVETDNYLSPQKNNNPTIVETDNYPSLQKNIENEIENILKEIVE